MAYHLSSEQYQRAVDYIAARRIDTELSRLGTAASVCGMAELLGHLASVPASRVMRDSDTRLADLDRPLTPPRSIEPGDYEAAPLRHRHEFDLDTNRCDVCERTHREVVDSSLPL